MQDRLVWVFQKSSGIGAKKETALFVVDKLQQQNTTSGSAPGSQEQESKVPLGTKYKNTHKNTEYCNFVLKEGYTGFHFSLFHKL